MLETLKRLLLGDCRTWHRTILRRRVRLLDYTWRSSSDTPIDVIIPAAPKDYDVLPVTIRFLQKNLKHPIGMIYVIAPGSDEIRQICSQEGGCFVDETTVLPVTKESIDYYVKGQDQSGWLFQQLLKLAGDQVCTHEHFLVVDSDTILVRPHCFLNGQKILFFFSTAYHKPYFRVYKNLLDEEPGACISHISHTMLFSKTILGQLKARIEEVNDVPWYEAVIECADKTELAGFSEYETYANFVMSRYPHRMRREYRSNVSLPRKQLDNFPAIQESLSRKYRTVSFHSYKR